MNCATWYWKGTKAALYGIDDDMETQNAFLDAMKFYGVTEIYYSSGANKLVNNKNVVETFVKNAYARDIKVYLLTGEKHGYMKIPIKQQLIVFLIKLQNITALWIMTHD